MFSMSMVSRRKADPRGFTLLEVIVAIGVLGIIMTPLAMSFVTALKQSQELHNNVGASADAQRIGAAWTQDVHNVDPNGVRYERGCNDGTEDEDPLVTFEWDTSPSTVAPGAEAVPKQAMWALRGNGPDAELVRLYCEQGSWINTDVIATAFWESGVDTSKAIYGYDENNKAKFCADDGKTCTITVDGNFYYRLTVERRVTGVAPPDVTTPPPPTITGAVGANASLTVAWLPSVVPVGVPPVDLYEIRIEDELGGGTVASQQLNGAALSAQFTGLINNKDYWIQARAHNTNGWGDWGGEFGPVQPVPVAPDPPTNVVATRGDQQITLSWTAPANNGGSGITSWRVRTKVTSTDEIVSSIVIAGGGNTSAVVTGLTNGTAVESTVSAINTAGEGSESLPSNSVTPCGVPYAPGEWVIDDHGTPETTDDTRTWVPRAPTVSQLQDRQVDVTYLSADANGCEVIRYRIYSTPAFTGTPPSPWQTIDSQPGSPAPTHYVTPSLAANTSYQFQVAAVNEVGEGPLSPISSQANVSCTPTGTGTNANPVGPGNLAWEPRWRPPQVINGVPNPYDNLGGLFTWTPFPNTPQFNCGFSITKYRVKMTEVGGSTQTFDVDGANSSQLDMGNFFQTAGVAPNETYKEYDVSVAAVNDNGAGAYTTMRVVSGGRPLGQVADLAGLPWTAGTTPGSSLIRVSWTPMEDTQPVINDDDSPYTPYKGNGGRPLNTTQTYWISWKKTSASTWQETWVNGVNSDHLDLPADPGAAYNIRVVPANASGRGIRIDTLTATAPDRPVAPAQSSVTLTRSSGALGNRLDLVFPAFTAGAGTPTPAYSALCTASGEPNQTFTGLTPGTNLLTRPQLTNGKAWSCTLSGMVTYGDGSTYTASVAANSSATPSTTPSIPQSVAVSALSGGKAHITWSAPASDGGAPITNYRINVSPAIAGYPALVSGSTFVFDTPNPLTYGTTYTFSVAALNVAGGSTTVSVNFTPTSSLPTAAPTNLTWTPVYPPGGVQPGQVTISWTPVPDTAPSNGGSTITGQTLTLSPAPTSGSATVTLGPAVSSYTYTTNQLSSGSLVSYTATIYATNAIGNGPTATATGVRSGGKPTVAVTGMSAQPYNAGGAIRLNWTPVANGAQQNGGKSIDGYNIYWSSGGGPESAPYFVSGYSQTGSALGGFNPGVAYTFRVVANNQGGASAGDAPVWGTFVTVAPGPPAVSGTPTLTKPPGSQATLVLNFNAFTVNSGSPPVTGYSAVCTSSNGGATVSYPTLNALPNTNTLSGLSLTKTYTCALTAKNGPFLDGNPGSTTVNVGPTTTGP
jgi:prepilin-type N-terminal cleavage/methylation domain-containing protein